MINHDPTLKTKATINNDVFELNVQSKFKANEEVFISYGELTNLDTLCDYGFVATENPYNSESIDLRLINHPSPIILCVSNDGSIDRNTISLLRMLLASTEEKHGRKLVTDFSSPVSDRNELDVFSFIATELSESAREANRGATMLSKEDTLVADYLAARASVFERAISRIRLKYPLVEF